MYPCSRTTRIAIGFGLAGLMLATRFHHFGDALHLPDASWAIFFLAGFYLPVDWLWGLMSLAVGIDYASIHWGGVAAYCITSAYVFLIPAYAALWAGGYWSASRHSLDGRGAARLLLTATLAIGLAFVVSNASFYWLGGRIADLSLATFADQFLRYFPRYLGINLLYLSMAALAHVLSVQYLQARQRA